MQGKSEDKAGLHGRVPLRQRLDKGRDRPALTAAFWALSSMDAPLIASVFDD